MPKYDASELAEIIEMLSFQHLDIRSVTLGINILPAAKEDDVPGAVSEIFRRKASQLSSVVREVSSRLGVDIVTKRVAVTPVSQLLDAKASSKEEAMGLGLRIAKSLDLAAKELSVDYVGGYAAFVESGFSLGDRALVESIPDALASTERVTAMVNAASTLAGINMDAVSMMGGVIKHTAQLTDGIGCTKLGVFVNAPEGTPFVPGAYHGRGEEDPVINVAVSGPGVIESVVRSLEGADLRTLHDAMKRAAFKITRLGELVGREVARRLGVRFGSVDLSLAPSPVVGDSVADVLRAMGVDEPGAPGTVLALAILTDAVKKGGAMATSSVGGLSGAFIPVSEDLGMAESVRKGALSLSALEAMASVCSTGLDMVVLPGDIEEHVLSAIIGDVMALGIVLDKSLGVRLIPAPGAREGDEVNFGGLLGEAPVMPVSRFSSKRLVERGGVVPPTVSRLLKG